MANYGRDKAEKQGNAGVAIAAGTLLGLVSMACEKAYEKNEKQKIIEEIGRINREIDNCKSGLLGRVINREKIARLEKKRNELQKKYDRLS